LESEQNSNVYQKNFWAGQFGDEYLTRTTTIEKQNSNYKARTGVTEEEVFKKIFEGVDKNIKILEVGCNIGLKLSILKKMGFKNLYGIEVNKKAFEIARQNIPTAQLFNTSIEEFNPNNERFDFVYTATMLVHVNPSALEAIASKIINLTTKYVGGLECYSDTLTEIRYRGHSNALWKQNFPLVFKKICPSLKTIIEEKIPYKNNNLFDIIYLLKKS